VVSKSPDAFRTISEVAEDLDLPQHVLRFWETRFTQIKPMKRGGGRRYYRPDDVDLLRGIKVLLYGEGYTIRGVQRILKEQGSRFVIGAGRGDYHGDGRQPDEPETAEALAGDFAVAERVGRRRVEPSFVAPAASSPPRAERRERRGGAGDFAAPGGPPADGGGAAGLAAEDIERLKATLAELLECKRVLDQAR
jgi:DNA-binding transcriptional MerR regulator